MRRKRSPIPIIPAMDCTAEEGLRRLLNTPPRAEKPRARRPRRRKAKTA